MTNEECFTAGCSGYEEKKVVGVVTPVSVNQERLQLQVHFFSSYCYTQYCRPFNFNGRNSTKRSNIAILPFHKSL